MDLQTTPRVPARTLTSQLSRSIVARLQAHGPMTLAALRLSLTGQHVSDTGLAKRLDKLQRVGHIERAPAQAGEPARWQATAVAQPAAPSPQPKPEVVAPRRVDVMSGTYQPTPTVLRAGALDYRKHPSLLLGERREYGARERDTST